MCIGLVGHVLDVIVDREQPPCHLEGRVRKDEKLLEAALKILEILVSQLSLHALPTYIAQATIRVFQPVQRRFFVEFSLEVRQQDGEEQRDAAVVAGQGGPVVEDALQTVEVFGKCRV